MLALGLGVAGAGCKKDPDNALVVFSVQVNASVPQLTAIDFTVDQRPDIPGGNVTGDATHRSFLFGYYLPGVNGNVTIVGQAVDAHGCVLGRGTLAVTGLKAGQTTTVDPSTPLVLAPASGGCGDGGIAPPHDGSVAPSRDGATDTGRVDAGGDRRDARPTTPDAGRSGDGPATKTQLGVACATGSDCASAFCVDGVCCESACTGSCQACGETGALGKCIAVKGTPHPAHPACAGAGTPCVGTCDGASLLMCSYPGASQACSAGACTNGTATLAAACDGKGGCPAAQTVSCAPNTCAGAICAGGCSATQPCTGNTYCAAGVCAPKKANGQTCATVTECTSGACADGYCCTTACTGTCMACNLTASPGTCSPVKSANDDTCSGTQSCDATGSCKKANGQTCTAATDCTSAACVDGTCCGGASCATCQACTGGGGTCVAVTSADDPGACSGTSSCDATGACKLKAGQTCTTAGQCVSSFCADGVCCNAACTGQCEACAEATSPGTCTAVSGTPRAGHGACAGAGSTCGGMCGGTNRTACAYPPASTSCRAASCTSGTATLAASCNGSGACPALQTVNCAPNTCSGTMCAGGCSASQPCAGSNYCSAGACVPQKGNGSTCLTGVECTSASCVDGVCCGTASCATCQTCATANGTCAAVTNADDPNSCTGTTTCDATGTCKTKTGQICTAGTQCLTGSCVDGVCCNSACSGTCQYCGGIAASNTPSGTCGNLSGTPKHGTCAGLGACQGICNGAQSTCAMPGSSVMCGPPPSCNTTTDISTAAAFCDGQGNCPNGSTGACNPFLCGGNACLTACSGTGTNQCVSGAACIGGSCQTCSSGLTACGNICANEASDPNHCGSCTTACSGTTPLCVNNKCVQCGTIADCHTGYAACTNNTCVCRQKSSNNILQNPGFDTNFTGWISPDGLATWSGSDADGCPGSGSLSPNNDAIDACFSNVLPNTFYSFGFKYLQDTGAAVNCVLNWTTDAACGDGLSRFFVTSGADPTTTWQSAVNSGTSDPGTISASLRCSTSGNVNLDQFFLNAVTASF